EGWVWLGLWGQVSDLSKGAGVGDVFPPPQPAHDMYQLFAHLHPHARREAQDFKLMFLCRLLGSTVTNTKIDTAAGHPVQAAELIGQQDRIPDGRQENCRA